MSTGIWSAASGAVAQTFALDVTANNIANGSTPGYRGDHAVFREELAKAVQRGDTRSLRYALTRSAATDMKAGNIVSTGQPLDVALRGERSFFVVKTPEGERFTRAGSMRLASNGTLTTPEGYVYLGADKKPLGVPLEAKSASVGRTGRLSVDGEETSSAVGVVRFEHPEALERVGNVLFSATAGAGTPTVAEPDLEPEALEGSNTPPLRGMCSIVAISRNFDMMTRVIEAFSNIDRKAATDVMKR